jgi:hypothetical protein
MLKRIFVFILMLFAYSVYSRPLTATQLLADNALEIQKNLSLIFQHKDVNTIENIETLISIESDNYASDLVLAYLNSYPRSFKIVKKYIVSIFPTIDPNLYVINKLKNFENISDKEYRDIIVSFCKMSLDKASSGLEDDVFHYYIELDMLRDFYPNLPGLNLEIDKLAKILDTF